MQLLVRFPNWIGDAVMATPILERLGKVSVVAKPHIQTLLSENPNIAHCYEPTAIPKNKYDCGVLLTNSFSSAWQFFRAGVRKRIGFTADFRRLLLTDPLPFPKNRYAQHLSLTYQELLKPLGKPLMKLPPRLFIAEAEKKVAKEMLGEGVTVGFHVSAAYGPAKCWPKERFHFVAANLMKEGIRCVFFGTLGDAVAIPEGAVNLFGKTTLRQLMACFAQCDLLISNDSGPMHIADALGTRVISIFGSTEPKYTGPFSNMENVIQKKVACAPCFKRECPIDFRCMRSIEEQDVIKKALSLLSAIPSM